MKPAGGVKAPTCPNCSAEAEFYPTAHLFIRNNGEFYGPLWACYRCDMWEWADKRTGEPKGPLLSGFQRQERRAKQQQERAQRSENTGDTK